MLRALLIWTSLSCCTAVVPLENHHLLLGSGERGLMFVRNGAIDQKEKPYTVSLVCVLDSGFQMVPGYGSNSDSSIVVIKETLSPDALANIPNTFWSGGPSCNIFSFGLEKGFSRNDLYSITNGHLVIQLGTVQKMARSEYGLLEGESFLGAFNGRIYYWKNADPGFVYFKMHGKCFQFRLPARVTKPLGVAKGNPKTDIAVQVVSKPLVSWYPSPRTFEWIGLDFGNALEVAQ